MPKFIAPQLLVRADHVPEGPQWIHEIKYDGFRILARRAGDAVKIQSRNDINRYESFQTVAAEIVRLPFRNGILDGEIAAPRQDGTTWLRDLQQAIKYRKQDIYYFVFDLLFLDGRDLRPLPLIERKGLLRELLQAPPPHIIYANYLQDVAAAEVFRRACNAGAEGVVSKRAQSPYRSGRHDSWVKVKCPRRTDERGKVANVSAVP